MEKYRLKRVFADGGHAFEDLQFTLRSNAISYADNCTFFEEGISYIDLYMSDKKIATFYK